MTTVRVNGVVVEVVDDEVQGAGQIVHGETRVELHVVDVQASLVASSMKEGVGVEVPSQPLLTNRCTQSSCSSVDDDREVVHMGRTFVRDPIQAGPVYCHVPLEHRQSRGTGTAALIA